MLRSTVSAVAAAAILSLVAPACSDDPAAPAGSDDPATPGVALARSTALPAGGRCAFGGTELAVGEDLDHDGTLDDNEIQRRSVSCFDPSLVRVDPEPAGDHCASGGKAVRQGLDRNHDGQLADDEVASTTYACDPAAVFSGDFTAEMWSDPAAVAALVGAEVITGNLEVAGPSAVPLPRLTVVGGTLSVASQLDGSTTLEVPALAIVGGTLDLAHQGLSGAIALPQLHRVGGAVRIAQAEVTALSAPVLTQVSGLVIDGTRIEHLALPALTDAGPFLGLQNNPALIDLALPALHQVIELVVLHDDALTALAGLDNLARATNVTIADNAAMAEAALPALEGLTNLTISGPVLTAIEFPRISFAGTVVIHDVPALEQVTLPSLLQANHIDAMAAPKLARLDLPVLNTLFGQRFSPTLSIALRVIGTAIDELSLPLLTMSGGRIEATLNPNLRAIDLPTLRVVDRIISEGNFRLTAISAPALVSATTISLVHSPIATLALGKLTTVVADLQIGDAALATLDGLGALQTVGGGLALVDNTQLASLAGLAKLSSVRGTVRIDRCPALSPDDIAALVARVHP